MLEVLLKNVEEVEELGDMQNGFCAKEINLEVSYTLDKCAKCSNGESRSNSINEEGSEDEIVTRYDDRENKEILKENWEQKEQANKQQGEDKRYKGYAKNRGVGNLNIIKRCKS